MYAILEAISYYVLCHLSCVPKKGDPKKGTPAKILYARLGRPRYISETRPAGSDSPKCFTLGLGRLPKFSHGNHPRSSDSKPFPNPARPRSGPTPCTRAAALVGAGCRRNFSNAMHCLHQRFRKSRCLRPQHQYRPSPQPLSLEGRGKKGEGA